MEYLNLFQEWFSRTEVYQQFLKNMPPPVNNIYFDTACVLVAVCYLAFRLADRVRIGVYHRKIRKRQAQAQREQREAERQLEQRETEVRGKEEKINRFMDACEFYFRNRGGRDAGGNGRQPGGFFSRIGRKNFLLEDGKGDADVSFEPVAETSEYEIRMREMEESRKQEEAFAERRRREQARVEDSMGILEEQIRVEPEVSVGEAVEAVADVRFEKRRARALREEQREREKAERAAEKKERRERKRGAGRNG